MKEKLQTWKARLTAPLRRAGECAAVRRAAAAADMLNRNPFPVQLCCILLFRLLLDIVYLKLISPTYAYARMTVDISPAVYLCSWAVVLAAAPFIARLNAEENGSSVMVTFLNYVYFIPLTSYCACKGTDPALLLVGAAYWAVLLGWQFRLPKIGLVPVAAHHVRGVFLLLTAAAFAVVLYASGRYTGFRFTLNFIDVYGIRFEAMAYDIPRLLKYILASMTVVMAVLLMYWLQRRRWLMVGALVFLFLLYYSIGAHKAVFFFLLLVLACHFFYRPWMYRWMSGFLCLAVMAAMVEKKVVGTIYLAFLGIYRMMYLPAQLAEETMAYFRVHPLNLFRDGIMGKFSFHSIYSAAIQYVTGEQSCYPESFANNGLLGDLFTNLPVVLGLLLMPLILVLCFRLMDLVSKGTEKRILFAFCVYFANSFMNMPWSSVLLTNAYLLACVLLYFFPKEEGLRS